MPRHPPLTLPLQPQLPRHRRRRRRRRPPARTLTPRGAPSRKLLRIHPRVAPPLLHPSSGPPRAHPGALERAREVPRRERRQRRQARARGAERHLDAAPEVVLPDDGGEVVGRDVAEGVHADDAGDAGDGGEGEDGHEELAFALLGVEVAEDGEGEEDGCEVGEDIDAAEGDPDGAEGQAFAGRRVGRYLLPEMLDGLADEGEGEDVGEGGGGVEVQEGRAEVFEEWDGENAAVEEEDGGFDEEVFQGVDDRGAPLGFV